MRSFLLILVALFLSPGVSAIQPNRTYIRMPEQVGLVYEDLDVRTQDGYRIATWFFPADRQAPQQTAAVPQSAGDSAIRRPAIVICNGDAGNMSYFQLHLARRWCEKGFHVITFDWRGFGASSEFEMDPDYLCYTEMLEDYRAVVSAVATLPEVDPQRIAVVGWSTGAYLSMIAAYDMPQVGAFIGRSLATDFEDFIPLVMQVRNKNRNQLLVPADFPTKRMPVHIASDFRKPIFLIVGENDIRTPVWMSRKILELLPQNTPRELMVVKDAAHGGNEDPMLIAFDEFIDRTARFLHNNLP